MYKLNLKSLSERIQRLWIGLTSLFLLLLLSSCASSPTLPPIKETEVIPVPKALTYPIPDPLEGESLSNLTNGQLVAIIRTYRSALLTCNSDKSLIEQFLVPSGTDGQPAVPSR